MWKLYYKCARLYCTKICGTECTTSWSMSTCLEQPWILTYQRPTAGYAGLSGYHWGLLQHMWQGRLKFCVKWSCSMFLGKGNIDVRSLPKRDEIYSKNMSSNLSSMRRSVLSPDKTLKHAPCKGIWPGFRNPGNFLLVESGITEGNFCLWNPGSWALESRIQLKKSH